MSAFFPDFIRTQLATTPTLFVGKTLKVVLLRQAPSFNSEDSRYQEISTLPELLAKPGWAEVSGTTGYPLASTIPANMYKPVGFTNNYFRADLYTFGTLADTEVAGFAFLLVGTYGGKVDPIVMVTTSPFDVGPQILRATDGITANPDIGLPVPPPPSNNRWLFSWADAAGGATQVTSMVEGPLSVYQGAPPFEVSHTQHVWLYPQRVNMIANPSFESASVNTGYWSTNGSASRVAIPNAALVGPTGSPAGAWSGRFQKAGTVIAESNWFPTQREEDWTIQLHAKGTGKLKVGFVAWNDEFNVLGTDWGTQTWTLNASSFIHISTCRTVAQAYQALIRLECDGGDLTIDQVLCEKGLLPDWDYFDGDSTYGARDDYMWYGGEVRKGGTYSLWYNNKRTIYGRMFGREVDSTALITDDVIAERGFIYKWVPAGTFINAHLGVLYPNDPMAPVPAKVAGVIAYRSGVSDTAGVVNPWVVDQYLIPALGTISTPDTPDMAITGMVRLSFRARFDAILGTGFPSVVIKQTAAPVREYLVFLYHPNTDLMVFSSADPALTSFTQATMLASTPLGVAHTFGVEVAPNATSIVSILDGVRTTQPAGQLVLPHTAAPVMIGGGDPNLQGRIYWAQLEKLDGTVIWRFDATEYPGTGTSYTDPRGRVWTLSNANAIGH